MLTQLLVDGKPTHLTGYTQAEQDLARKLIMRGRVLKGLRTRQSHLPFSNYTEVTYYLAYSRAIKRHEAKSGAVLNELVRTSGSLARAACLVAALSAKPARTTRRRQFLNVYLAPECLPGGFAHEG